VADFGQISAVQLRTPELPQIRPGGRRTASAWGPQSGTT